MRHEFARRWLLGCILAEAAGIALVALAYTLVERNGLHPAPLILGAGAGEGLLLGSAQALMLHRFGTRRASWIALTVLAAVAGYGMSLLGGAGSDAVGNEPPIWLIAAAAAAAGGGMGAVMGLVQAPALPDKVGARGWIFANVIGWAFAMIAIMLGAASAGPGWPLAAVAAVGALSGALAGAVVGLATLWPLARAFGEKP
jgi:hypothetical protein